MTSSETLLAEPAEPGAQAYGCPACGAPHTPGISLNKACDLCASRAIDSRGRALRFEAVGRGDAFEARYALNADTGGEIALDVTTFRTCFIGGQPFHVARDAEHGIHLLSMADILPGRRR